LFVAEFQTLFLQWGLDKTEAAMMTKCCLLATLPVFLISAAQGMFHELFLRSKQIQQQYLQKMSVVGKGLLIRLS